MTYKQYCHLKAGDKVRYNSGVYPIEFIDRSSGDCQLQTIERFPSIWVHYSNLTKV